MFHRQPTYKHRVHCKTYRPTLKRLTLCKRIFLRWICSSYIFSSFLCFALSLPSLYHVLVVSFISMFISFSFIACNVRDSVSERERWTICRSVGLLDRYWCWGIRCTLSCFLGASNLIACSCQMTRVRWNANENNRTEEKRTPTLGDDIKQKLLNC